MRDDFIREHVLGGVYGQALGDSFAMPALLRPEVTWKRFGWFTGFMDAPDDHPAHHGLKAGRVTDDTEQAMSLAQVILAEGRMTVEGAAQAIVAWYDQVDGDHNDKVGPSTRRAVTLLKKGADPHSTGRQGDTDGGAMRVSPVGLVNPGDIEGAVKEAAVACLPSHNTDVAISGAAAVAAAIAAALTPGADLEVVIAAGKRGAELGLRYGNPWMGASIARRIQMAVDLSRQEKSEYACLVDIYDLVGSGLATSEAVPAAFGVLAMAQGDPMGAARYAANLSGDADTVAAMACAIAGAWKGIRAFPADVLATLDRANPEWDFRGIAAGLAEVAERRSTQRGAGGEDAG